MQIKTIEQVCEKVKKKQMPDLLKDIFECGQHSDRCKEYNIDTCTSIYIDLKGAYDEKFMRNRIRVGSNIEAAFNDASKYIWNPENNKLDSFPMNVDEANQLLENFEYFQVLASMEELPPKVKHFINHYIIWFIRKIRKIFKSFVWST